MSDRVHYISPKYFRAMCDDTGIFRHAVLDTADRAHGYCIDDNARALLASYSLAAEGEECDAELLGNRFVAFIQHAWNPDECRFRNFMGFTAERCGRSAFAAATIPPPCGENGRDHCSKEVTRRWRPFGRRVPGLLGY
jgi:hypothetical protein